MRSQLPALAEELGANERTLRRVIQRGTLRSRRTSPRGLELNVGELAYLRSHWDLLSRLTRALRTESNVRLAVLYGSSARGDDRAGSDVDVLVSFADDDASTSALARRLEAALDRPVDVARLSRVRKEAPFLLLQVVDEGRVLVDRDDQWAALKERRETVGRAARRQLTRDSSDAMRSLAMLDEEL